MDHKNLYVKGKNCIIKHFNSLKENNNDKNILKERKFSPKNIFVEAT